MLPPFGLRVNGPHGRGRGNRGARRLRLTHQRGRGHSVLSTIGRARRGVTVLNASAANQIAWRFGRKLAALPYLGSCAGPEMPRDDGPAARWNKLYS